MSAVLFHAVFKAICENGKFDDSHLADDSTRKHWSLDGVIAFQEGDVQGIETPTMRVTQCNCPPMMWKGSEVELVRLAQKYAPEVLKRF